MATAIFRVDGNATVGLGHLSRCIGLAEVLIIGGWEVKFFSSINNQGQRLLESSSPDIELVSVDDSVDLEPIIERIVQGGPTFLVVDGYHLKQRSTWFDRFSEIAPLLIFDDDSDMVAYKASVLVNQNVTGSYYDYTVNKGCVQLLGTDYFVFRNKILEVVDADYPECCESDRLKLLITMGGIDQTGVILKILSALDCFDTQNIDVAIVGNVSTSGLRDSMEGKPGISVNSYQFSVDLSHYMKWADVAICSSGTTGFEMLLVGVPIIVVSVAENQVAIAKELHRLGLAVYCGDADNIDADLLIHTIELLSNECKRRRVVASLSRNVTDGLGRERIVDVMEEIMFSYAS